MTRNDPIKDFLDKPTAVEQGAFAPIMAYVERHSKAFSILGLAWLWFSIAVWARWITLPEIPFLTKDQVATLGIIYNAGWWGFVRPRIMKMKSAYDAEKDVSNG
ncbi:hypothetical protein [Erythrobacter rubeus]|uniref:Holin of 3TMs, for gene-transfer release n=1 Tax=Erythrobacter rubeus TaxID=2760803 RepID=A0ABR8KU77_9SPHN|nr:hypothetical protein [Erythrobacter rubeus]MBD2841696.1 hypothetical protein [Erythrobacter rubeus]